MAIKRCESFDHWVTADAPKKGWAFHSTTGISAGNGRNGTASVRTTQPSGTPGAQLSVGNSARTGVVGFALRCATLPSVDSALVAFIEGGTDHVNLYLLTTGAIRVRRGSSVLNTSVSTPITGATYVFVECAVNLHDTTGSYDVRVNGASVVSGSGVDTQNALTGIWNGVRLWGGGAPSGTWDVDDLYVADDTTFRGDHRIVCVLPSTGNGTNTAWTPSTGTDHGALVDDASPNTSDYVTSSSAGAVDSYNFPAVGVAGTVAGVQQSLYCKAEVAGVRLLKPQSVIGGISYDGTGALLPADWTYLTEFYPTSPATATAWTVAEIDAAEFGQHLHT